MLLNKSKRANLWVKNMRARASCLCPLPSLWWFHLPFSSQVWQTVLGAPVFICRQDQPERRRRAWLSVFSFKWVRKTSPDPTQLISPQSTQGKRDDRKWFELIPGMSGSTVMTTTLIFLHLFILHSCQEYFPLSISFFHSLHSSEISCIFQSSLFTSCLPSIHPSIHVWTIKDESDTEIWRHHGEAYRHSFCPHGAYILAWQTNITKADQVRAALISYNKSYK